MSFFKKILACSLILCIVFSFAVVASAENYEEYSKKITVADKAVIDIDVAQYIFKKHIVSVVKSKSSPFVGITEHIMDDGSVGVTAINYSNKPIDFDMEISESFSLERFLYGKGEEENNRIVSSLQAGEMCIFSLNKK